MKKAIAIWIICAFAATVALSQSADSVQHKFEFSDVTLKNALDSIAVHFSLRLSYSDSRINSGRKVSGKYSAFSQQDFLTKFLNDQELHYNIIDDQVVIFPFNTNQSTKISGRVTNAEDGAPIAFASIALPDLNKGTVTNEDGEFTLDMADLPQQIAVSHIAYEKKLVYVYEDQTPLDIRLRLAPRELKGLTVKSRRDQNAYYQMLKNAREIITKKLGEAQYGKAFYRQKSERQGRYTEIFEMFYDVKYTRNGIDDWALQEGRYAFQNNDEYDVFLYNKNFTLLSRMFTLLQPATESYLLPFHVDARELFELSLSEIIIYEGRHIAIINYVPKPSVDKPAARGQIYIDYESSEVFKMTGTFTDSSMNVIGFSDSESSWANYQLSFDISFGENDNDGLKLDYIRVDHQFNYYYNEKFIGKIHTNSFLSFYEHYKPAIAKKLGGSVDFKTSDTQTIDRIGYNREFWLQNPIVKRTPLEEKLILDFDKNEAFGLVFLNKEEQVMLLPDRKNSEKARKIIEGFEQAAEKTPQHRVYLQTDKVDYQTDDRIRFAGYVVDPWTLRSSVTGSVLNVRISDYSGFLMATKSYDINHGAAYGEIDLAGMRPGFYLISANLNTDTTTLFSRKFAVRQGELSTDITSTPAGLPSITRFVAAPEGGLLMADMPSKLIIAGFDDHDEIVTTAWIITDDAGTPVNRVNREPDGIGQCLLVPKANTRYFAQQEGIDSATRWPLPMVLTEGICLSVSDRGLNSLRVEIHQKPAFSREIFILCVATGKVFSLYEKKLTGVTTAIDLPSQHLPPGINELVLTDARGHILARTRFFVEPSSLNVAYTSGVWKSRKNHTMELTFKVTDMSGEPVQANLSALCSSDTSGAFNEISSGLLLANSFIPSSLLQRIPGAKLTETADKLLLLHQNIIPKKGAIDSAGHAMPEEELVMDTKIIAEVSVSGIAAGPAQTGRIQKENSKTSLKNETFWLPRLLMSQDGIALIDVPADPGSPVVIAIQGLSNHGDIADFREMIHPDTLKEKVNNKQKRNK